MRRLGTLTAALLLVAPAPAVADTVARRTPVVGPKIAGDRTVWGEERNEGVTVMLGSRGATPRALYRLPDSGEPKTERSFFHTPWSLAASATHVAAVVLTGTITYESSDSVGTTRTAGAVGGPFDGLTLLSGRTPPRGDAPCEGGVTRPDAVAVDGARIAVAEEHGACGDREPAARIVIRDGDAMRTLPVPPLSTTRLALAGRYVAWIEHGYLDETLVVHDLETGTDVLRERHSIVYDVDLDADGTIALTYADGQRDRGRLALVRAGTPGRRVLARGGAGSVAVAAGRVLYTKRDPGSLRSQLLLREIAGGTRRLATFTARRRQVGDIDLAPDRAVWAAQKMRSADYEAKPSGPARIVSRPL